MSGDEIVGNIRSAVEVFDWSTKNEHEKAIKALAVPDYRAAAEACRRALECQLRIVSLLEAIDE